MSIYTKRGDKGKTSTLTKDRKEVRVGKDSDIIEAIGTIDELNTFLGTVVSFDKKNELSKKIERVQQNLFVISSTLAGLKMDFDKEEVLRLEREIDSIENKLPVLKNFIYPGGGQLGSHLHLARSVSRRAERRVVKLSKKKRIPSVEMKYLNRLSDYLYTLAREANHKEKRKEKIWKI